MKKSTVIVLVLIALVFGVYSFSVLADDQEKERELIYEKDIKGVLGPGNPHDLEVKKQEAYLTNLWISKDREEKPILGDYFYFCSSVNVSGGLRIVTREVLYYQPEDLAFEKTKKYIAKTNWEKPWDQELYEYHLERAYLIAVEMYPDVFAPTSFLEWYMGGEE